jgi:hypothetical protein
MMGKKPSPAEHRPAGGWYYLRTGAPESGRVGPLTWEELQDHASSGVLWPIDLVLHPDLPQWAEAGQIPGLFPRIVRPSADRRSPSPRRTCPPVASPFCEQPREHLAYQQAWTAPSPRRRPWVLPFLLPLLVTLIIGGALALYLSLWRAPDGGGKQQSENSPGAIVLDKNVVDGYWRGTLTLTVFRLEDSTASAPGGKDPGVLTPSGIALLVLRNVPLQVSIRMEATENSDCCGASVWLVDLGQKFRVPTIAGQKGPPVSLVSEPRTIPFTESAGGLRFGLASVRDALATATATVTRTGEIVAMRGVWSTFGPGYTMMGVFGVTKQR